MLKPAIPENEAGRLRALEALHLLYTPAEERFDRITRIAGQLLGTPIAFVALLSEKCNWFKSIYTPGRYETPRESPREISFCGHAILNDETFVVEDTVDDERFADNPLVAGEYNIRAYAGHPIHANDGSAIGTLCVMDHEPRRFSERDRSTLRDLAALVESELQRDQFGEVQRELVAQVDELARKASIDGLTMLWNRETIMRLLAMEASRAARGKPLIVAMIDVDNFKEINDEHGHRAGDQVLAAVAASLRRGVRDFDAVGRYGGDEFIAILGDCRDEAAAAAFERIRAEIARSTIETPSGALSVTVTIGVASHTNGVPAVHELVDAADRALYAAKKAGRNRVEIAYVSE